MKNIEISFNEITPNVRFIRQVICTPGFCDKKRLVYDHMFAYVFKGSGIIEVNGKSYIASSGDLFYVKPGVLHSFEASLEDPYVLIGIHFDYTSTHRQLPFPIGPFASGSFLHERITENVSFFDFRGFPDMINIKAEPKIQDLLLEMLYIFEESRIYSQCRLNGNFAVWLSVLARFVSCRQNGLYSRGTMDATNLIDKILKYIQENFNSNLSNNDIAKKFHFHPNYLSRLIVANTGVSLRHYLINIRIKNALSMIINTDMSVTNISRSVGYDNVNYFSRLIKEKTGYSPTQLKMNNRNIQELE